MLLVIGSSTSEGGPGLVLARAEGGALTALCVTDTLSNPIWAEQGAKTGTLYVAGTSPNGRDGRAASFSLAGGAPRETSSQPTAGTHTCHLHVNADETMLYAANYSDGSLSVFPVSEGKVLPLKQHIPLTGALGPNKGRQERNHAHQVMPRPGAPELYVCDLGADEVVRFSVLPDGTLSRREAIACVPGTGPRHLVFDGSDRFYLVGELGGWISVYECRHDVWHCAQTLSTLPPDADPSVNTAAAIRLAHGKAYVSNRGHNSIAAFRVRSDGLLAAAGYIPIPGDFPRDFLPDAEGGFYVAQQKAGGVAKIDGAGAQLAALEVKAAVSLLPIDEASVRVMG